MKINERFYNLYHPSFLFSSDDFYSLKNLNTKETKASAAIIFVSLINLFKEYDLAHFGDNAFKVDRNLLPKIDLSQFNENLINDNFFILNLTKKIIFGDVDIARGKIKKEFENSALFLRSFFKRHHFEIEEFLFGFLDSFRKDKININFPPLWETLIYFKDRIDLLEKGKNHFSANYKIHRLFLKNWIQREKFNLFESEELNPLPYATLLSFLKKVLGEDEAVVFLKKFLGEGEEKLKEELKELVEREKLKWILFLNECDDYSFKIFNDLSFNLKENLIIFSKKGAEKFFEIEKIHFLFLGKWGEEWLISYLKESAPNWDMLADALFNFKSFSFSPYSSIFKREFCLKEKDYDGSLFYLKKSFEKSDEERASYHFIKSLIESGQAQQALEELAYIDSTKEEFLLLECEAKIITSNSALTMNRENMLKGIKGENHFDFLILYSQYLYLKGDIEEAEKTCENLLKDEVNSEKRFKILNNLFFITAGKGELEKSRAILKEMEKIKGGKIKEELLIWHHKGMLNKLSHKFEEALESYSKALDLAGKGLYFYHQTLLNIEIGNIMRLLNRFEEGEKYLIRAFYGGKILRNNELESKAYFDLLILETEKGELLKAEEKIKGIIEKRKKEQPVIERVIEDYWLARIYYLRGLYSEAFEILNRVIKSGLNTINIELYFSILILKGFVSYKLNNFNSLSSIVSALKRANIFNYGHDFVVEFQALTLLLAEKKLIDLKEEDIEFFEKNVAFASDSSKILYLLSRGRYQKNNKEEFFLKALDLSRKSRNIYGFCEALLSLNEINRLVDIAEEERREVERFIIENRIEGDLSSLLKIVVPYRKINEKKEDGVKIFTEILKEDDLNRIGLKIKETLKIDGLFLVFKNHSFKFPEEHEIFRFKDLYELAFIEGDNYFKDYFLYSTSSNTGIFGVIFSKVPLEKEKIERFKIFINLIKESSFIGGAKEDEKELGFLDEFLIGSSQKMVDIKRKIIEASKFDFPVLITGEAGSGKELCAKAIHLLSKRGKREWVAFNCANLTPTLATSQLFGHKKGSFTGAESDREGLVSFANDTTLFLDEIGELPLETQAQFLRYLQDGSYQPLGSNKTLYSNARIIAATNRNLKEEIQKGNFREDLYYRLNVLSITLPPLRERREDIVPLFNRFLEEETRKSNIPCPKIGKGVYSKLLKHSFPGNVRELQNLVKRAIVSSFHNGILKESDISFEEFIPQKGMGLKEKLKEYEKSEIMALLKKHSYDISKCAKEAQLSKQAFYERAKKLGLLR